MISVFREQTFNCFLERLPICLIAGIAAPEAIALSYLAYRGGALR
jgi:hypothetical protein